MSPTSRTQDDRTVTRRPADRIPRVRVSPAGSGAPADHDVDQDLETVETWLRDYVSRPDTRMGRNGPVCPFVPPALQSDAMEFRLHYDAGLTGGDALSHIRRTVEAELADFGATAEPDLRSGPSLRSRLVVFPRLGPDGWRGLDQVYESLKYAAVGSGLMTGQFHPLCDERAARNPAFRVSISPIGLYAIRRMAPHDVLFLHERAEWFATYDRLFRTHYERGRVRDPLLRELYLTSLTRHDLPPLVPVSQ